jgi:hypothetical protein
MSHCSPLKCKAQMTRSLRVLPRKYRLSDVEGVVNTPKLGKHIVIIDVVLRDVVVWSSRQRTALAWWGITGDRQSSQREADCQWTTSSSSDIHLSKLALLTRNVLLLKDLERDGREPTWPSSSTSLTVSEVGRFERFRPTTVGPFQVSKTDGCHATWRP